jgi:NIMA (never in mitosis gene a)-related kinase
MPLSDFEIRKFLGKGSYGSVFKASRSSDGQVYAVKEINVST